MVVIEPEPEEEVAEKTSDAAKASASHSTVNGDSDGFETASEGDADADADDAAGDGGGGGVDLNQHQEPREGNDAAVEQSTSPKDDSQIGAADDESNQVSPWFRVCVQLANLPLVCSCLYSFQFRRLCNRFIYASWEFSLYRMSSGWSFINLGEFVFWLND